MTIKEFDVRRGKDIKAYLVTNGKYCVAILDEAQAFMVCNMINRMIRQELKGDV